MYDIIIPNWNQSDLCVALLKSIEKHSSDYRVIFVDNGSKKREFNKIYKVLKEMPHLLIRNPENLGFVKAVNQGLAASSAPYIVIQNNDTEAVDNWLPMLKEGLDMHQSVGLSGPLTTTPDSWQGKWIQKTGSHLIMRPKNSMLAFFCVMMKREVLEKVGYLSEDFGVGFGDDDHYCWMAHNAGYRLVLNQNLTIPHHHRSTFKEIYSDEEIEKMQKENLMKYYKKTNQKVPERFKEHPTVQPKPKIEFTPAPKPPKVIPGKKKYILVTDVNPEHLLREKYKKQYKLIDLDNI